MNEQVRRNTEISKFMCSYEAKFKAAKDSGDRRTAADLAYQYVNILKEIGRCGCPAIIEAGEFAQAFGLIDKDEMARLRIPDWQRSGTKDYECVQHDMGKGVASDAVYAFFKRERPKHK